MTTTSDRPWMRYYGNVPASIDYPRVTLYEAVAATAQRSPEAVAWDFFGTAANYRELLASIDSCANALASLELKAGDRLLISMPTAPAGIVAFYAANKLGVVPAVMLGYLDDPQATAETLRVHADGRTWLHTGDLGRRDDDGFFHFTVRARRLIKSSGFNVYPAQVESVLYQHPLLAEACVIGVADAAQAERVKAVVVLKDPALESDATAQQLIDFCRERLIKWSCPREVEFRRELPKTRVGKIDFRMLVAEHEARAAPSPPSPLPRGERGAE